MIKPDSLPTEMQDGLRLLDPATELPAAGPAQRAEVEARILRTVGPVVPGHGDGAEPVRSKTGYVRRRSGRPGLRWGAGIAVAAGVVALVAVIGPGGSRGPVAVPADPALQATDQVVAAWSPLAAGRDVECGGLAVPSAELMGPGGAENGTSAESAALRAFLADNPWREMSPVSGQDWRLLARSGDQVVFGQRQGRIGVGPVVTLTRQQAGLVPTGLGGCGLLIPGAGERAVSISSASLSGTTLRLRWSADTCGSDPAADLAAGARVEQSRTATGLHVLVVIPSATHDYQWCAGTARPGSTTLRLTEPLGGSDVIDDAHVGGQLVPWR